MPSVRVGILATVRDLTVNGVGLVAEYAFDPGTVIQIHLVNRVTRFVVTRTGSVVHTRSEGTNAFMIGCLFEQPLTDEELGNLTE